MLLCKRCFVARILLQIIVILIDASRDYLTLYDEHFLRLMSVTNSSADDGDFLLNDTDCKTPDCKNPCL